MDSNHLNQTLISVYKELHQNPELSYEEYQTTKRLRELLEKADIEILDFPFKGFLAHLQRIIEKNG